MGTVILALVPVHVHVVAARPRINVLQTCKYARETAPIDDLCLLDLIIWKKRVQLSEAALTSLWTSQ